MQNLTARLLIGLIVGYAAYHVLMRLWLPASNVEVAVILALCSIVVVATTIGLGRPPRSGS